MSKVKLQPVQKTKVVEVPGYPGSEVEIYDSLLLGEVTDDLTKGSRGEQAARMLAKCIKSWNFTDENDANAAITPETISQYFTAHQAKFLMDAITEFASATKKD